MSLHPVTLAFRHGQRHLEKKFLRQYVASSVFIIRLTALFSVLLYGSFGILDALVTPENKIFFWIIRYAVYCPFALFVFALTYTKQWHRIMQPAASATAILAGGGIVCMVLVASPPITYAYYMGLILVFMVSYTGTRLRFIWATFSGWTIVILYEMTTLFLIDVPIPVLINNNFFCISANLIGMFSSYAFEYYARRDFFMQELLKIEQEKVRNARDRLEERVQERTAEVVKAHLQLKREMAERIRMEKEQKCIQEQLQRRQRMESIGLMASGVAHDLNNILSGTIGYPELLLLKLPENSDLRPALEAIRESGQKAATVVADLLTIARGAASTRGVYDLNTLVQEYLDSPEFRHVQSLYPDIRYEQRLTAADANMSCSAIHVSKCIMNLVLNAAEAVAEKGTVIISTCNQRIDNIKDVDGTDADSAVSGNSPPSGEYVVLRVEDSGPGIPADVLDRIFEPFYSTKIMGKSGSGLGLSVVWNTMEDHNGKVTVASSDKGTCFHLYFPGAGRKKQTRQADIREKNIAGNNEHILVVDDDRQLLDIADKMLTHLGYRVDTVSSGEAALDFVGSTPVDLIMLDMLMEPGMNGRQTYEEIIKLYPEQKAIVVSGFSESGEAKTLLRLGASGFISKPYSIKALGRAVSEALQAETG
ncbi:MAG: response regulator [Candidatus Electrothrix sp. YB6]